MNLGAPATGVAGWSEGDIEGLLDQFNLAHTTGLSALAVEMMPRYDQYILFWTGAGYLRAPAVTTVGPIPDSANITIVRCAADLLR